MEVKSILNKNGFVSWIKKATKGSCFKSLEKTVFRKNLVTHSRIKALTYTF
jgi:hypothetical protein|tara:strand:+ start:130 stop:282 length:153 start_codon:yes stop_codon:yes gene_type:complete